MAIHSHRRQPHTSISTYIPKATRPTKKGFKFYMYQSPPAKPPPHPPKTPNQVEKLCNHQQSIYVIQYL